MSRIAVVVPSFNRPDRLALCLDALERLEGGPYPTFIVDDGSPTPLQPVCERYDWVTCIRQENAGPAAARNAGAKAARAAGANLLCFTDDDCCPDPCWVAALAATHASDPDRLVGGRVENALAENVYSGASQSLCDYLYDYFGATEGDAPFFTSNNMACDADRFTEFGGFDDSFPLAAAEDRDFGLRWRDTMGPLVYAPEAVVAHAHQLSFGKFFRQHVNYGRGARHLHRTMDRRGDTRPRREPMAFYFGLLAHPLRDHQPYPLRRAALMGLSQVAMVAGYAAEVRTRG